MKILFLISTLANGGAERAMSNITMHLPDGVEADLLVNSISGLASSYTYFRIKGIYRIFYGMFNKVVQVFFKGDVNGFTNWISQKGILK